MTTDAESTALGDVFSSTQITFASTSCSNVSVSTDDRAAREKAVLNCSLDSDLQCIISFWLYAISMPVLIAGGTVGNALTIAVMATKAMGKTAFGTYIAAIAVADILVLWTTVPRHFVRWIWLIDIRQLNQWSCRTLRFLQFSLMQTSAWLLVTVTVERFLNIYYPTKFRLYKRRGRARRVVAAVAFVHFAWNAHIFWTLGEQRVDACTTRQCGYPDPAYAYYWTKVHPWVDFCKLSLLPFAAMLSLNVAIVLSLRKRAAAKCRSHVQPRRQRQRPHRVSSGASSVARACSKLAGERRADAAAADAKPSPSAKTTDNTKTLMLLWVSFFYVITTAPTFVSTVLDNMNVGSPPLLSSVATVVFYVNNAANFFLYSLSGATFRRLLVATLKRHSRSASWSSSTSKRSATTTGLSSSQAERAAANSNCRKSSDPTQSPQQLRPPDIVASVGAASTE